MAPWISPNKTVEGLVGGMLAALLVVVLLHFTGLEPWDQELRDAIWLGLVIAVAAPLGDFAESMLKRNLGIKDFGTLLPGPWRRPRPHRRHALRGPVGVLPLPRRPAVWLVVPHRVASDLWIWLLCRPSTRAC